MEENKVTKVVTTLNTGKATPIVVSKTDAAALAQAQSVALEEQHQEKVRQLKIKVGDVTTEQPVINKQPDENNKPKINKESLPIETQAAVEELYAPKTMYKLVPQKTNWKLVAILSLILLVIIFIILIELSIFK